MACKFPRFTFLCYLATKRDMNIKHTTKLIPKDPTLLQLLIVSEEYRGIAFDLLQSNFGVTSPPDSLAEKGKQKLFGDRDSSLLTVGIGNPKNEHESVRRAVAAAVNHANNFGYKQLQITYPHVNHSGKSQVYTAISEAAFLSNYQFLKYKTNPKKNPLEEVLVYSADIGDAAFLERGEKIACATSIARDLVNEPVITLTAEEISNRCIGYEKELGLSVEVLNKAKIQALKMGGLLAVNSGSVDPPTFTIIEWKPDSVINERPVVLVGKGVVYDTGGLSLKPTLNSMDKMKADMSGAAAVIGTIYGSASLGLPIHLIGLVPATDNRPGQNAITPGDVITMYDGTKVEILNTDAEGRLILADALAYAKKYDPELCIDLATLTGAQVTAIGDHGSAMMATAGKKVCENLKNAGNRVYERLVELPLWDEYRDQLNSDIADLKNIGGSHAGCITAGKFLEHFTDFPWVHLDIAGPAFISGNDAYRLKNGTGVGVRLLLEFLTSYCEGEIRIN